MKEKLKALIKQYEIGFDKWGLVLFLAVLLPNIIWYFVPLENDVLDLPSITPVLDKIGAVVQTVAVGALCILRNVDGRRPAPTANKVFICIFILIDYIGWGLYFAGIVTVPVLLMLTLAPIITLMIFSSARKNVLAYYSFAVFLIFHLVFVSMNFIIHSN